MIGSQGMRQKVCLTGVQGLSEWKGRIAVTAQVRNRRSSMNLQRQMLTAPFGLDLVRRRSRSTFVRSRSSILSISILAMPPIAGQIPRANGQLAVPFATAIRRQASSARSSSHWQRFSAPLDTGLTRVRTQTVTTGANLDLKMFAQSGIPSVRRRETRPRSKLIGGLEISNSRGTTAPR